MTTTTMEARVSAAAGTAPDLSHPALAPYLATLPPDPDLDRHAVDLTAAWSTLSAEQERGVGLARRRGELTAALTGATGDARAAALGEILLIDADRATLPPSIGAAVSAYALARLGWFSRVLALAEAEARGLVAATDAPIGALGRARHAVDVAAGYFGASPAPEKVPGLRAAAAAMAADLAPAVERHRRATEAASMVRAFVAAAFGEVVGFSGSTYGEARPWQAVAERAGEHAAERARRDAA